jgi:hypothetical protein
MSLNNPVLGEGYVPAYQISAVPFVTASQVVLGEVDQINFPTVTRFITVKNFTASTAIAVGFTQNGLKPTNANFITLSGSDSFSGELRTSALFISGALGTASYQVVAGLTNIPVKNFLTVTGSNGYSGVG